MPESETLSGRSRNALADASGNYVALDLGDGRHAFYEHPEPGSIRVAPGQTVRRGEVIADHGSTGDKPGPHLHRHVHHRPSRRGADGVASIFHRPDGNGRYTN